MIYLVTNITDGSPVPRDISIGDIPNARSVINVAPGQTMDLEKLFTRNQICESKHIKSWVNQGYLVVDTLGTEPDENCRIWVNANVSGITIDNVTLKEPVEISVAVNGVETAVTGVNFDGQTYLNINPLLPNTPKIDEVILSSPNAEQPYPLPINSKKFMVYTEDDECIELSYQSNGTTITIPCGDNYSEENIDGSSVTLYFKSQSSPTTVKIVSWSVV